uniref:UPF3 domain-containing protein n=1 Tax=Nymphaea colorata TaxID=210225 RepID=A0A5K0UVW6_9MAGN
MKDPLDRTKVVLRHLPPSISQAVLMEQVDARFAGRYRWTAFRPGKTRSAFLASLPIFSISSSLAAIVVVVGVRVIAFDVNLRGHGV